MNKTEFLQFAKGQAAERHAIMDTAQKEYAHANDSPFSNFQLVGNMLGLDRKLVCGVYMLKHVFGIASFLKGNEQQREDITGRIHDTHNYLDLLAGMIAEERSIAAQEVDDNLFNSPLTVTEQELGDVVVDVTKDMIKDLEHFVAPATKKIVFGSGPRDLKLDD